MNIRRQLTLFVDPKDAEIIEQVRRKFNPIQFELIKSHVTLCREDEIQHLEQVRSNLLSLAQNAIVIEFGKATRLDGGLFLPATTDHADFQALRSKVLIGLNDHPNKQEPHITLMHPRNSTCTDAMYDEICTLNFPTTLVFRSIDLIEQVNGGQWKTLQKFPLAAIA